MPYLCFSVNLDEGQEPPEDEERQDHLLAECLTDSFVHASPTLDEWYYQFAENDKESTSERLYRNRNQVVTRYLEEDKSLAPNRSELKLLRVKQIWIWTIGNSKLRTSGFLYSFTDNRDPKNGSLPQVLTYLA